LTRVNFAPIRVRGKVREERLTVESLELKEQEREKDNAETQRAQRFRREDGVAGTGWRLTNTTNVTIYANTLSSVYWNAIRIICGKLRKSQKPHTQTEPVKKQLGRMLRGRVQELFVRRGCYD
jgi:hypothetical protein